MIPVILKIGPIPINSFGLMVAVAILAAGARLSKSFENNGIDPGYGDRISFVGAISGIIGARLWYMFENISEWTGSFFSELFSSAGFTFYGGFIFAALVVLLYVRLKGLSAVRVADSVGPALCVGYAIGRLGCQLSGDGDYGAVTNSFWGMSYSTGVVATPPGILVYPTPFFESLATIFVMFILIRAETFKSWGYPLARFGLYLVLMSLERFFIEFIRIEKRFAHGLSEAQYIAVILFIIGVTLILRRQKPQQFQTHQVL